MPEIPVNALARSARIAAVPLGHAGRAALSMGKRLGGAPAEAVAAEVQARTAEQVFRTLGELKGGAMKFGQAMSIFEAALPEEMAGPYRATLTRLQDSAPAMPASQVHDVLATNFGPRWRRRFRSFDDRPAAAASIGQVHRGVWRDGREVAVKVQYPGADKALMADLRTLSRLARLMTSWMPGVDVKPLLDELTARVSEELDYTREAAAQQRFAAAYHDDPEFAIPDVLASGPTAIVSMWQDGIPLSRIITEGTTEQRDRAGQLYQRFLLSGPERAKLLHADPHPGNFRIAPDGRFAVLDFGAVAHLPGGLPPAIGTLLGRALTGDGQTVLAGLRDEGFIKAGTEIDPADLLAFLDPLVDPARVAVFHYSRAWLRGQFTRLNNPRSSDFATGVRIVLPPSYLLIHRVWLGGVGVLCQLDAHVAMRDELEEWVPGFREAADGG